MRTVWLIWSHTLDHVSMWDTPANRPSEFPSVDAALKEISEGSEEIVDNDLDEAPVQARIADDDTYLIAGTAYTLSALRDAAGLEGAL